MKDGVVIPACLESFLAVNALGQKKKDSEQVGMTVQKGVEQG
jgi:hypothetical protein